MKQTVQMQKIQDRLRAGQITKDGFLGKDSRNLADIILDDDSAIKRMGYDHKAIAERMMFFRKEGEKGLGEFVDVPPYFSVSVDTIRGKLPCPFECRKILPKSVVVVRNLRIAKELSYTDIQIHLILFHSFYQGRGSLYRIEPQDIIEILEVEKPEL